MCCCCCARTSPDSNVCTTVQVAFHALRFAAPIQAVGDMLAKRMWQQGPYVALHLRLEKDVWVRTGCLPGLGPRYDAVVNRTRARAPKLLTGRSNMTYDERKLAGLCPMNAAEVVRYGRGVLQVLTLMSIRSCRFPCMCSCSRLQV